MTFSQQAVQDVSNLRPHVQMHSRLHALPHTYTVAKQQVCFITLHLDSQRPKQDKPDGLYRSLLLIPRYRTKSPSFSTLSTTFSRLSLHSVARPNLPTPTLTTLSLISQPSSSRPFSTSASLGAKRNTYN